MIKELEIENLFGKFKYEFSLQEGGVSIITGPNGYGKSTILKIIDSLSNKRIEFFFTLEFSEIVLTFDDETKFSLTKRSDVLRFGDIKLGKSDIKKIFRNIIRHRGPYRQINDFEYINLISDKKISIFEHWDQIDDSLIEEVGNQVDLGFESKSLNELINDVSKKIGKSRLVSDQRLIKKISLNRFEDDNDIVDAVSELPSKLKEIIEGVSSKYSTVANELDSTYPNRLLESKEVINEKQYEKKLEEASIKFKKLSEYNLTKIQPLGEGQFKTEYATALKIYFDDFSKKYSVFEKLVNQLELFTSIINNRLTFKEIKISRDEGIIIIDSGRKLELTKLSSGEKQEIVLFFDLIFNTDNYELLMIDEPELSLHISWQQKFLDDLLKVTHMNKLCVIISTHSPQIIGTHRDIQIDLGEIYNGK